MEREKERQFHRGRDSMEEDRRTDRQTCTKGESQDTERRMSLSWSVCLLSLCPSVCMSVSLSVSFSLSVRLFLDHGESGLCELRVKSLRWEQGWDCICLPVCICLSACLYPSVCHSFFLSLSLSVSPSLWLWLSGIIGCLAEGLMKL